MSKIPDTIDSGKDLLEKGNTTNVPKAGSMTEAQWKVWAIRQLQDKAKEKGGTPTKADFEAVEKIRIKAALGPWPRALEAAGLKEPKEKKLNARRR